MNSQHRIDRNGHLMEGRAANLLRRFAGLALPGHRWPLLRATLEGLAADGTVEGALDQLEAGDQAAKRALLASITVPETYLFRHPHHFEVLAEHASVAAATGRAASYRVLSAGCATGEEAWSAAAVLDRVGRKTGLRWEVSGWDLDANRIAHARAGQYSAWSARDGLAGYDDAFEPRGRGWQVHPRLRVPVGFECVNLKTGPVPDPASFDAVFLRNVAIYWAPECLTEMLLRVANLVSSGGLLLMGASEPESLNRAEWTVDWRGAVRIATRQPSEGQSTLDRERDQRPRVAPAATRPLGAVAERGASEAAPICPDSLERVRELADRGSYLEALLVLDELPPIAEADLYRWRGILLLNLGRAHEALVCLRKAVFLAPHDVDCRHWLAVVLSTCGHHEAAAREHRNLRELSSAGASAPELSE